ncbi:MAG: saccharopine dehydrogenase NADP-binding domain-containing protein [Parvibaculum sp.]
MTGRFMIYGATGYTGKLMTRMARKAGLKPILAGRSEAKLKSISNQYGFEARAFDLMDRAAIDTALADVDVVLHVAGPFSATSKPMIDACLRTGTHYLDITGEISVFEACARRDEAAKEAGIMILPGVGFDVVPSDCLAAHMKRRMPDATDLVLGISGLGSTSRGTAKTMIESIGEGTRVRRGGRIVSAGRAPELDIDYGSGPKKSVAIGWGDVSTAYHSTGIPNITVFFEANPQISQMASLGGFTRFLLSLGFMQRRLKAREDAKPDGPSEHERAAGHGVLVGEVTNESGERMVSRLRTPEGYTLTYMTGLDIVRRVLAGDFKIGFQTPSLAYGADYISSVDGCVLEDLNR